MTKVAYMPRLLLPAVACPVCGTPPNIRVTETERMIAASQPPDQEKMTYQCQRRQCGHIYMIRAKDVHRAA